MTSSRTPVRAARLIFAFLGTVSLIAGSTVAATAAAQELPLALDNADPLALIVAEDAIDFAHEPSRFILRADPLPWPAGEPGDALDADRLAWTATTRAPHVTVLDDRYAETATVLELVAADGPGIVEISRTSDATTLLSTSSAEWAKTSVGPEQGESVTWSFSVPGIYTLVLGATTTAPDAGVRATPGRTIEIDVASPNAAPSPEITATPGVTPSPEPTSLPSDTSAPTPDATPEPTETEEPSPDEPAADKPAAEGDQHAPTAQAEQSDLDGAAPQAVDPTVVPEGALDAPDPAMLNDANRGGVEIAAESVAPDSTLTVAVPGDHGSHWVSVWLLSTPVDLGWKQVGEASTVTATVPADAELGEHRVVVRDRTGALIGWAPLAVTDEQSAVEECIATPVTTTVGAGEVDVVTSGHLDFGPVVEGGQLRALLKDDRRSPAEWVDPATLVMHLNDNASVQAPGGAFSFLGDGTVWQIPLTQDAGIPWLGWNTQHSSVAGRTQGEITLTLDGVDGPGELAVYSLDSWGGLGATYFGTVDDFPRSTRIPVGASGVHVHGIWAFTEPGAYHVTLTFSGAVDGSQRSGTAVLTFFVGAGDAASAAREQTAVTYVGRTPSGEECTLALAETGADAHTADLAGLAGTLIVVGLAFLGASALAPRTTAPARRQQRFKTS